MKTKNQLPQLGLRSELFIIFFLILWVQFGTLKAQTIENIQSEVKQRLDNPFQLSGNLGLSLGVYQSYGISARRDNFSYLFTGNVTASLLGIAIPLDGNFSQLEENFLQPFNQIGISPKYKWVKGHLGYRNMSFSPLTLDNHTFLGAGLEIEPPIKSKKIGLRISGMYGRFRRPVAAVDAQKEDALPVYRRMGYGFKTGVFSKKEAANYLDFILFRGYDDVNSIQQPFGNNAVKPEDNLVLGVSGQYKLFNALTLKADWATSAFTRDQRAEKAVESLGVFSKLEGIFTPRISTQANQSLKADLSYKISTHSIGLKYNYIASDYRTLGTYFFQNDIEDITLNASTALKEGKIMLSGSLGLQRNNLDEKSQNESKRVIGSLNYSHVINSQLNIYASYTNFSSSLLVVKEELSDSLNFFQVTTGYNLGSTYNMGTKDRRQSLSANFSYQVANSRDEYSVSDISTEFFTGNLFYNLYMKPKELGFNATVNYTRSISQENTSTIIGPGFGVIKKYPKKGIKARYFLSYRNNFLGGSSSFGVLQNRLGVEYNMTKRQKISFKMSHLYKIDGIDSDKSYSEIQGMTSYRLSF